MAAFLGKSEAAIKKGLLRAKGRITNFPSVLLYVHEELKKREEKGESMKEEVNYTYKDVMYAMTQLQQRRCKPMHFETSSIHFNQVLKSLDLDSSLARVSETVQQQRKLYGMDIVLNENLEEPEVQWRPDGDRAHQKEVVRMVT